MNLSATSESAAYMVLSNHIYEYQKGVRHLVLFTLRKELARRAVDRLNHLGTDNIVQEAGGSNVNIYLGRPQCIRAISTFVSRPLYSLTPEEDFILGSLLGYDLCMQCERYCDRKTRPN